MEVAESDSGGGARDDDAGVAESDESDEEADASANCGMELVWDCSDQALADARKGERKEDDSGDEDGAERGLPGDAHTFDDRVGEVGVEAHAWGKREWVVCECAHEDASEGCAEAGGGGDGGQRHSGLRQDGWINEDDVSHRDEGGDAGENLSAPVGSVLVEAEVVLQAMADWSQVKLLWVWETWLETKMSGAFTA